MLFLGPVHASTGPILEPPNATARRASLAVKSTVTTAAQASDQPDPVDTASVLAEAPSYLLLPTLREIFEDPDRAARKGQFRVIQADSLDLPPDRSAPNPAAASLWINHLPPPIAAIFREQSHTFFEQPLNIYVNTGLQARTLPPPTTHASKSQYCALLKRADSAGMLQWSLVDEEDKGYSQLADAIQLSLFAVSKSKDRTRLISWPRIQNDALPDPPYTYLPEPSLFEAIEVRTANLSAFLLDVENMFHNITLPEWLTKLFPLQTIHARDLDAATLQNIQKQLPRLRVNGNQLLRPCQATMPMGFKWAVFVAHSFVAGCLDHAYKLFRASRFTPPHIETPHTLHAEKAPFCVGPTKPIVLHIIDDVACVAAGWSHEQMTAWHRITRRVLAANRLPVNDKKSTKLGTLERKEVIFIGCRWNLQTMSITPTPDKLTHAIRQCSILIRAKAVSATEWQRIIGKLVWIATLNRPLLSCMQRVFAAPSDDRTQIIEIKDSWKREMRTLFPLLPLATSNLRMDIAPLVIAFDASLEAGAVARTTIGKTLASSLWNQAQSARCSRTLPQNLELPVVKLIAKTYPWKKVMAHRWINEEHINGLEAAAAVLALESAIRAGVHNQRIIMFTDSLVVLGALQKGRSSSPIILARCRRFAALALAHNIRVTLVYVKSANNPADEHTRSS